MRVPVGVKFGDLAHLSDEPRRSDYRASTFGGLSLTRADTEARLASNPVTDMKVEERVIEKFDRDAKKLRKEMRGRVRGNGER